MSELVWSSGLWSRSLCNVGRLEPEPKIWAPAPQPWSESCRRYSNLLFFIKVMERKQFLGLKSWNACSQLWFASAELQRL